MNRGAKIAMARDYCVPTLRQEDLALRLGVSRPTLARWESTGHVPEKYLDALSEILNVQVAWLSDEGNSEPTTARLRPIEEPVNIRALTRTEEMGRSGSMMVSEGFVALPIWRGVLAGSEHECSFESSDSPEFQEIPGFYTMGHPDRYVLCVATGMSMSPRIDHADRVLVRLEPDVPVGCLVVARNHEGQNYIKKLVKGDRHLELHSLNAHFPPITSLNGWQIKGGVVMIRHNYEPGRPNIEWNEGQFLRG